MQKNSNDAQSSPYIDLLKRALTGWGEVGMTLWMPEGWRPQDWVKPKWNEIREELNAEGWGICRPVEIEEATRRNGKDWPFTGATMVGWDRLTQWEKAIYRCLDRGVPGDVVETGIWRGGVLMLAAAIFQEQGVKDRKIWGYDSFEGLPPVNTEAYPADTAKWDISRYKALSVSQDMVRQMFERWNVPMDDVNLVQGWFKDTLKNPEVQQIAALRLDGDYYESTIQALEALEPRVSDNGIIVIDDYEAFPGCKQAVDEYRARHGISDPLQNIDDVGCFWIKNEAEAEGKAGWARRKTREKLMGKDRDWLLQLRDRQTETRKAALEQFLGPQRFDWINEVIRKRGYEDYLEIGVRNPAECFDRIECTRKTSVDPGIEFEANPVDFQLTSDAFFAQFRANQLEGLTHHHRWDLIFIDGLHQAEQVNRDIENAIKHLKPGGMIVLHDCWPPNERHALDSIPQWEDLETLGAWNGSTWRAFYRQWLMGRRRTYLINADWGIGVIDTAGQQPQRGLADFWGLHSLETFKKTIEAAGDCLTYEQAKAQLLTTRSQPVHNDHGRPKGYWNSIEQPPTRNPNNPLDEILRTDLDLPIIKWDVFLDPYHNHLNPLRGKSPRVLEIGVFGGGSIELWSKYFGPEARICGLDINPACADMPMPPNANVVIGPQADPAVLEKALVWLEAAPDVIIDDGSHKAEDIAATFKFLWPKLADGGWYVIEDLHTAYWSDYNGQYNSDQTSIALLQQLLNDLQGYHHTHGAQHVPALEIGAVHVYDSIAFIAKTNRPEPRLVRSPEQKPA